eukprot:COSAG04_NODE_4864_length_1856_cov_1.807627_1_plen_181_part_10
MAIAFTAPHHDGAGEERESRGENSRLLDLRILPLLRAPLLGRHLHVDHSGVDLPALYAAMTLSVVVAEFRRPSARHAILPRIDSQPQRPPLLTSHPAGLRWVSAGLQYRPVLEKSTRIVHPDRPTAWYWAGESRRWPRLAELDPLNPLHLARPQQGGGVGGAPSGGGGGGGPWGGGGGGGG